MEQRTDHGIDLGFDKPYIVKSTADGGNSIPENGDSKPAGAEPEPKREASTIAGYTTIDPFEFDKFDIIESTEQQTGIDTGNSGTTGTEPKRRGRPRGSKNRDTGYTTQKTTPNLADLEALLLSVHFMGAKLLSAPEWELDKDEAKKLSDAIKEVAKHYSMIMDPKKLALCQLGFCMVGVYGPRAIVTAKRVYGKPKVFQTPPATQPKVFQMPPASQPEASKQAMNGPTTIPTAVVPTIQIMNPSQLWDLPPSDDIDL